MSTLPHVGAGYSSQIWIRITANEFNQNFARGCGLWLLRKKVILFSEVSCAAFDYDGSFATVGFVYDENYLLTYTP